MYPQTDPPYICFICKENPGDPKSDIRVTLERKQMLTLRTERSEITDVIVPRCQNCLAAEKKETKENARVAVPAILAGIATLLISIFTKQPEWFVYVSCTSVAIVIFVIGMVAVLRRKGKLSLSEREYLVRAGAPDVENYPAVSLLLHADYKIISRAGKR
jgi:hypothetical protein